MRKPYKANLRLVFITKVIDQVAEIDRKKVADLATLVTDRAPLPPAVLIDCGDGVYIPIDGHHRAHAAQIAGRPIDAYTIPLAVWDELSCEMDPPAEEFIRCGHYLPHEVAEVFNNGSKKQRLTMMA